MRRIKTDDAGAYCPNCGGRELTPYRRLLILSQRLRCVACGRRFRYGRKALPRNPRIILAAAVTAGVVAISVGQPLLGISVILVAVFGIAGQRLFAAL